MKSHSNENELRFSFPALLTQDLKDGGFVVTFRDLPEAITQGDSEEEALKEAVDCIDEAIAARIEYDLDIPCPSSKHDNEHFVRLSILIALKTALTLAIRESKMSQVELAHNLNIAPREVRRILDPSHNTKAATMQRALEVFGKEIELCMF